MDGRYRDDVARLLRALEPTQSKLLALFDRKRIALRKARPAELLTIADEESVLIEQLQLHLARREQILREANGSGLSCQSLAELLRRIGEPDDGELSKRLDQVRDNADLLRRESWVQWIIAQRVHRHYSDVLEIIAHRGQTSPTYSKSRNTGNNAGALFDASI